MNIISYNNSEIRLAIQKSRLRYFEVASAIGISESTFSRWLRFELPDEKKKMILSAIDRLVERG